MDAHASGRCYSEPLACNAGNAASEKPQRVEIPRTFMHVDAPEETGYLRAMNAVMRPKHEVSVLTNEAIEVHLASLRTGQEE